MKIKSIERPTANVTILHTEEGRIMYSYDTIVGVRVNGTSYHTKVKYSVTTSKHLSWYWDENSTPVPQDELEAMTTEMGC